MSKQKKQPAPTAAGTVPLWLKMGALIGNAIASRRDPMDAPLAPHQVPVRRVKQPAAVEAVAALLQMAR